MKNTLKRLQSRFPEASVIYQTDKIPSGVNLFNALKKLPDSQFKGNNYFNNFNEIIAELYRLSKID